MITDPAIPRDNGVLMLCHSCQRQVYWKRGFIRLLCDSLEYMARRHPNRRAA